MIMASGDEFYQPQQQYAIELEDDAEDYGESDDQGLEEEKEANWDLPDLGTVADRYTKRLYSPLSVTTVKLSVGRRLLVKRSTGDW